MALKNPMVLKNLMRGRKASHDPADAPRLSLSETGLLPGLEALPSVVLVLERRNLHIAFANPAAEALLELSRRQLM